MSVFWTALTNSVLEVLKTLTGLFLLFPPGDDHIVPGTVQAGQYTEAEDGRLDVLFAPKEVLLYPIGVLLIPTDVLLIPTGVLRIQKACC